MSWRVLVRHAAAAHTGCSHGCCRGCAAAKLALATEAMPPAMPPALPAGQAVAEGQVDGRAVDVHVSALASEAKHACECPGQLSCCALASSHGTEQPMCALRAGPLTRHRQAAGSSSRGSCARPLPLGVAVAPLAVQLLHVLLHMHACWLELAKAAAAVICRADLSAAHAPPCRCKSSASPL